MLRTITYLSLALCFSTPLPAQSIWTSIQSLWTTVDYVKLCTEKKQSTSCLKAAEIAHKKHELHKAEFYSALACQQGLEKGCRNQRTFHDLRKDLTKDYTMALKRFSRRCQDKESKACTKIADAAEKVGFSKIAIQKHKESCELEAPISCQWLSSWYEGQQETEKAKDYQEKAKLYLHKLQYGILPEDNTTTPEENAEEDTE